MSFSLRSFTALLVLYVCFVSSCEKESTKAKEDDTDIDACAYEEQFSTIQALIDAASAGDTILIDPGTYEGSINFQGKDIVVGSLFLTTGDSSYISQTILDAKQSGSVVRFENNESSGAVLSGLTLTGGHAVEGGGIFISGASPTLSHLLITGNKAYSCEVGDYFKAASGGGIYMEGGNPALSKVMVSQNSSEGEGGGIYMSSADPSMDLVTVRNNTATDLGGGIYFSNSGPMLSRVVVEDNEAKDGGGLYLAALSSPDLVNTVVGNNTASNEGGGLYLNNAQTGFENVTVWADSAGTNGGTLFLKGGTVKTRNSILGTGRGGPSRIWYSTSGASSSMTIRYTGVNGGLEGIETNDNGNVDWGEGNVDDQTDFEGVDCWCIMGNYCGEPPQYTAAGTWFWGSVLFDKGDQGSQYDDEENRWCLWVYSYIYASGWAGASEVVAYPDTTTARNDLGAFGGPNGDWGIIHAKHGSDWE
jgi:predicted outer membrane repeat protein